MPLVLEHKRTKLATIRRRYPNAPIIDVTSRGDQPWVKFSPFYPHGNIPVPLSSPHVAASVEGIWQALKVFEHADVDPAKFTIVSMKGLKRSVRSYGAVRGHRAGITGTDLLSYRATRIAIYLPSYLWVLDHCLQPEVTQLREMSHAQTVVLLDYETNTDLEDLNKPLSHAGLIICYIEGNWPNLAS